MKQLFTKTRYLLAALGAFTVLGTAGAAQSAQYVDYWGDDLFLGLEFHRFGCHTNDVKVLSNQDYDGFTTRRYCFANQAWDSLETAGYTFLDWNTTTGKPQLDACGTRANNAYDTPNYAAHSDTCQYNILMDCNSDCWIQEFSACQGKEIDIFSPCL